MSDLLYNENNLISRLYRYFYIYFRNCSMPIVETLFLLVLSILAMESASSIRSLYRYFLSEITKKSLYAFYYVCSYAKVDYSKFMDVTTNMALKLIPNKLSSQPVFLCIDDTMVLKFGKKFENISKLFDHAAHNGSNYLNGHCFVSIMLCVPVWNRNRIHYLSLPLGYRMWQKKESKLELDASMIRQVMPQLRTRKNIIILCDSWYVNKDLVSIVDEFKNLDLIENVRSDSVIYDLKPQRTGNRGRPASHGKKLSIYDDFTLSDEQIRNFYIAMLCVLANIFGKMEVLAYVTSPEKASGNRRLFFSTVFPEQLQIFCAWQEKAQLNHAGSIWMQCIPLFLYSFRWNIEVSYYEGKKIWSLCSYMVRSCKEIEMLVNFINISYCAMKLLPYQDEAFYKYQTESVQEFRFVLSEQICQQVFYAIFVGKIETSIKSNALKQLIQKQGYHL